MEYRFKVEEWKNLTPAQRIHRCHLMAEEARSLANGGSDSLKHRYTRIAEEWVQLAKDIEAADRRGTYPLPQK